MQYQCLLNEIDMPIATAGPAGPASKIWFLDYIKDAYSGMLSTLLKFITTFKQLPACGLKNKEWGIKR